MFANATKTVGISQRVVATLVACALTLLSVGAWNIAQAADLANISNTLSDSDTGSVSSHTISFTIPTGSTLANTDTITVTWDSQDDGIGGQDFGDINTLLVGDISVEVGGTPDPALTFAASANDISFTGIDATAGQVVEIVVADGKVVNPTTVGSYEIEVDTGNGDLGRTRVAILDNVLVTAIVDTVFDFTVSGHATGTTVNGTTTTGSTTPTEINFGKLVAGQIESLAQELTVQTNARNGFVVTVESDGDLESANGAVIDNFLDGSDVADTGTAWTSPTNDIGDDTTWGHWGLTSNDGDLNSLGGYYSGEFGANDFIAASTTPRQVFHHDGPADAATDDIGLIDVLYQIEITPLQEAADDYNTTLTYIATPTF